MEVEHAHLNQVFFMMDTLRKLHSDFYMFMKFEVQGALRRTLAPVAQAHTSSMAILEVIHPPPVPKG